MVYSDFSNTTSTLPEEGEDNVTKKIVTFAVTGLVELFTGAVVNAVIKNVDGGRFARFGAKIGGALVGLVIGDRVSDYVCNAMDDISKTIDEIKDAIEEGDA